MPKSTSQEPASQDMEKLLLSVYSYIPDIVRNACHSLGHRPQQMELDGMGEEIVLLLMDDDYHVLKSFEPESDDLESDEFKSEFSKWLFTIAWRCALHRFQKQSRFVSLEDLPDDSLVSPPDQEAAVMLRERNEQLEAALEKLSPRKRLLFDLLGRGSGTKKIAAKMGIQAASVSPMRDAMIKRLQRILEEDGKMDKPGSGLEKK